MFRTIWKYCELCTLEYYCKYIVPLQCSITDPRTGAAPSVGFANPLPHTGLTTNSTILNKLSTIVGVTVDNLDFIYFAFSAGNKQYINKVSSQYSLVQFK